MQKLTLLFVCAIPVFAADDATNAALESHKKRLLEIAQGYTKYTRADSMPYMAPEDCRAPMPQTSLTRFSQSDDPKTHGQKLYFLFVDNLYAYESLTVRDKEVPDAKLAIVKESWTKKETDLKELPPPVYESDAAPETKKRRMAHSYQPYIMKDKKIYHAETKSSLYIMFKTDPKTVQSDDGWVYGTVSPDGKTVTSAGKVSACMACHKDAPHGRLFGLPRKEPAKQK